MSPEDYFRAGISYDEGVHRFMGNAAMYESFLQKFIADPSFSQLEQAMNQQDYEAAFSAAHMLKGVAGNLSLKSLYEAVVPLVEMLRGQSDIPHAQTQFAAAAEQYHSVIEFLKKAKKQ